MSAGGSGAPAEGAVDANVILAIGIIGGLLGIYLSGINPVIGPVLSCLGAVCAILWGVIAIRSVASYGLGTGVPSIRIFKINWIRNCWTYSCINLCNDYWIISCYCS